MRRRNGSENEAPTLGHLETAEKEAGEMAQQVKAFVPKSDAFVSSLGL